MVSGGQPMDKTLFYPSQTSLGSIHEPRRDGRLSGFEREIRTWNLELGDSRHLLRLRYLEPILENANL